MSIPKGVEGDGVRLLAAGAGMRMALPGMNSGTRGEASGSPCCVFPVTIWMTEEHNFAMYKLHVLAWGNKTIKGVAGSSFYYPSLAFCVLSDIQRIADCSCSGSI